MINNVVLVGRLTKDPELRKTQSNISYVRFTVAIDRTYTDPSGETKADFVPCIAWRNQAENLARFKKKGSLVGVQGRVQTGSYEAEEGMRYTFDILADSIQFLEPKSRNESEPANEYYDVQKEIITDDDLPF